MARSCSAPVRINYAKLRGYTPVILEPEAWPMWLGEERGDHAALLRPAPVGTVRLWPVSRAVSHVRNNGPELLAPIVDAGPETAEEAQLDANQREAGMVTVWSFAAGLIFRVVAIAATRPDRSIKRRVRLEAKYATSPHLKTIVDGKVVAGMTEADVVNAWGKPAQRTQQVLKTKTKDVLRFGSGRYASRMTLENGRVVGRTKSG